MAKDGAVAGHALSEVERRRAHTQALPSQLRGAAPQGLLEGRRRRSPRPAGLLRQARRFRIHKVDQVRRRHADEAGPPHHLGGGQRITSEGREPDVLGGQQPLLGPAVRRQWALACPFGELPDEMTDVSNRFQYQPICPHRHKAAFVIGHRNVPNYPADPVSPRKTVPREQTTLRRSLHRRGCRADPARPEASPCTTPPSAIILSVIVHPHRPAIIPLAEPRADTVTVPARHDRRANTRTVLKSTGPPTPCRTPTAGCGFSERARTKR